MGRRRRPKRLDTRREYLIWCTKHRDWESDDSFSQCEYARERPSEGPCEWMKDPSVTGIIETPEDS